MDRMEPKNAVGKYVCRQRTCRPIPYQKLMQIGQVTMGFCKISGMFPFSMSPTFPSIIPWLRHAYMVSPDKLLSIAAIKTSGNPFLNAVLNAVRQEIHLRLIRTYFYVT